MPEPWEGITAQTAFTFRGIPELGLEKDFEADVRVYILRCDGGAWYVGIAHKNWIGRRIQQHFSGEGGAHFTLRFRPSKVALVWPAHMRAVEAYVYFTLLETVPAGNCHRLGGWTQTSSNPSPLVGLLVREARRGLGWGHASSAGAATSWGRALASKRS